jgi:hypothetical protein
VGVVEHHNCLGLEEDLDLALEEGLRTFPVAAKELHSSLEVVEELRSFPGEAEVDPGSRAVVEALRSFPGEAEVVPGSRAVVEGLRSFPGEEVVVPGFPDVAEEGLRNFPEAEEVLVEDGIVRRTTRPREELNVEAFLLSQSWEVALEVVVRPSEAVVVRVKDVRNQAGVVHNFQAHQVEAERPIITIVSERRELS